ncbi:hypothetical protein U1Q18_022633 [Sarracenia purpurea var. burkii]
MGISFGCEGKNFSGMDEVPEKKGFQWGLDSKLTKMVFRLIPGNHFSELGFFGDSGMIQTIEKARVLIRKVHQSTVFGSDGLRRRDAEPTPETRLAKLSPPAATVSSAKMERDRRVF